MLAGQRKLVKRDTCHVWKSNFMPEKSGIEFIFAGAKFKKMAPFVLLSVVLCCIFVVSLSL